MADAQIIYGHNFVPPLKFAQSCFKNFVKTL